MQGNSRLAADIGGTFTDVVLDTPAGRHTAKVLTTSGAPEAGVFEALDRVLAQGATAAPDVGVFVHGTTLATNALIERTGARTAFLTTRGFRDILEMGFEKRFEQYDIFMDKPAPLVPRPLRREVDERVSARGEVLVPLDTEGVREIAAEWRADGVEAVAVGLLHAYAHPAHERAVREILSAELPGATVCLSSEVCPEIREYERFSTTCANAYVRPLMSGYLLRLEEELRARGMTCPFYLMMSGGGVTTVENAARFPVRLVESGPAGGAILAGHVARECGLSEAFSLDMGGTTAKICLIGNGTPERSRTFEVARRYRDLKGSGLPVRVPVIEMVEIGAGGGSIAGVDAMRRLRVGPASAGAEPGPACYGRGGERATVTDANLVLGKLDPERFAGGRIALHPERAAAALARDVGERPRSRRPLAGGRGGGDGRREHGERGPGPRHRTGQGDRAPHDGRVRRRRSAARRSARPEARHRAGGDPDRGGGGLRHRVPARAHRLRGGPDAAGRLPRLRSRPRQRDARRDAGGGDRRRARRRPAGRGALRRPGGRAALRRTGP